MTQQGNPQEHEKRRDRNQDAPRPIKSSQDEPWWKRRHIIAWAANVITFIAMFFAGWLVWETSRQIDRTDQALLLNISQVKIARETMIAQNRAWIGLDSIEIDWRDTRKNRIETYRPLTLHVKNFGHTPAERIWSTVHIIADDTIPTSGDFKSMFQTPLHFDTVFQQGFGTLAPNQQFEQIGWLTDSLKPELLNRINSPDRKHRLVMRGVFYYLDYFGGLDSSLFWRFYDGKARKFFIEGINEMR